MERTNLEDRYVIKVVALIYFLLMNSLVYILMAYDKKQAKKGKWRVPERRLLTLGILGGGLGGLLSQKFYRHKTQKPVFYVCFILGVFLMMLTVYYLYR